MTAVAAWGGWRAGWKVWAAVTVPLVLVVLLLAADRIAAGYARDRIAQRMERYGFAAKPAVTVEGFPFLTQLIGGRLDAVDVSSSRLRLGAATASVHARAAGVTLGSGSAAGRIARLTGSGLVGFPALDRLAAAAGVPGLAVAYAGRGELRVRLNLPVITVTATATVTAAPPDLLRIRVVSAPVPSFLLRHFRTITLHLPRFPLHLGLRSVTVLPSGVLVRVSGTNVAFRR